MSSTFQTEMARRVGHIVPMCFETMSECCVLSAHLSSPHTPTTPCFLHLAPMRNSYPGGRRPHRILACRLQHLHTDCTLNQMLDATWSGPKQHFVSRLGTDQSDRACFKRPRAGIPECVSHKHFRCPPVRAVAMEFIFPPGSTAAVAGFEHLETWLWSHVSAQLSAAVEPELPGLDKNRTTFRFSVASPRLPNRRRNRSKYLANLVAPCIFGHLITSFDPK